MGSKGNERSRLYRYNTHFQVFYRVLPLFALCVGVCDFGFGGSGLKAGLLCLWVL